MRCDGRPVRPGTGTTQGMSKASQPETQNGTLFADTIRASSLNRLHQQAGQKTAPDQCHCVNLALATREPSTEDMPRCPTGVRFSNRPLGVKHFQTIHQCGVDVARGLLLLFGIGTRALPSWDSKTRRNNLSVGVAVSQTAGPSGLTNSPHPSSREGHPSTAGWISVFSYRV